MRNSVWDFYRDKLIIFYCSRQLGSKENIFSGPVWKLNISVATWSTALGQGKHSDAPSIQDIFRRIFLSNCWWQKSDIWSQASYRYAILWVAFLDPSDSYFLFLYLYHVWKLNISVATWSTALGQGKHSDALGTLSPVKFFVPCNHSLHIDILVPT
jgi:hypothetical protein